MALMHEVLDALRHPEATLNRVKWQEAVDRLEDWMHDVEARIEGKAPAADHDGDIHGIVVAHSPDTKEENHAVEAPATQS